MIYLIGIKNCNKIRDTKTWLSSNKVDFEFIDLKKEPLTESELRELEFKVGLDVLINRKGTTYRNLGLKDKDLSEDELFQVLLKNQNMMKRPILTNEEAVLVGYDEEAFEGFVKEDEEND